MNEQETEQIRQKLLRLKSELLELGEKLRESSEPVELDQSRVGRLSRMDAMRAQQMALESARRRQHQLSKIEGALRRIDAGEFGDCFECGEEIDARRLCADPTITRCLACAEK